MTKQEFIQNAIKLRKEGRSFAKGTIICSDCANNMTETGLCNDCPYIDHRDCEAHFIDDLIDEIAKLREKYEAQLEYKGYRASVRYDSESKIIFGKITGISDLVTFEAYNASEVEKEFHNAVNAYLEICKTERRRPSTYEIEQFFKGV